MKILYAAYARLPTTKAHGIAIMRTCESFARVGNQVELFAMQGEEQGERDPFAWYEIEKSFTVRTAWVPNLVRRIPSAIPFYLQSALFFVQAVIRATVAPRDVVYTRIAALSLLTVLGIPTIYECHQVPRRTKLFFALCRRASGVVVISHALKRTFESHGFAPDKLLVAPSGVDLSVFNILTSQDQARKELDLPEGQLVLYTGSFTTMGEDKGIHDILLALRRLPSVRFVAVGGRPGDIERYSTEAKQAEVATQALFVGTASQVTLALYQRAADILLMPFPDTRHYREHMSPIKMFEYMASGRPIIATRLPTIEEVLNTSNALLVPPGDPDALANAIRQLLEDSDTREALAAQALKDVAAYSWQERAKRVSAFISRRTGI